MDAAIGAAQNEKGNDMYQVIDTKTGAVVGTYQDARRARAARDRKDAAYGAVRYAVRPVSA